MKALTCGQVAQACGVAVRTATTWIDRGMIKGWKIPNSRGEEHRRVLLDELITFARKNGIPLDLRGIGIAVSIVIIGEDYEALAAVLQQQGYLVETAGNAFDAGVAIGRLQPQVILVDERFAAITEGITIRRTMLASEIVKLIELSAM